ncbi:hypothetical protein H5410_059577 [Solanum commersonii]|uniref:Uncharacterized protein n=1 Tax=Solanum commersonii TaxID=4109 RepID=A0A9J5W2S6_SOLCO|nr:hypothetical protein H5410_059577 [Solanum commersonii]
MRHWGCTWPAQFKVHGEQILDEALNFTITQLKLSLPKLSNSQLAQQITSALKFPIKDGIVRVVERIGTCEFITLYKRQIGRHLLLEFRCLI